MIYDVNCEFSCCVYLSDSTNVAPAGFYSNWTLVCILNRCVFSVSVFFVCFVLTESWLGRGVDLSIQQAGDHMCIRSPPFGRIGNAPAWILSCSSYIWGQLQEKKTNCIESVGISGRLVDVMFLLK